MRYLPHFLILLAISVLFITGCREKPPAFEIKPRDTTITAQNAVTTLLFDSLAMESYIAGQKVEDSLADRMRSFYNSRNYQFAWFDSTGLAEYAHSFLSAQSQFISYSRDSSLFNPLLQKLLDSTSSDTMPVRYSAAEQLRTELLLTQSFFQYAMKAYQGDKSLDARDLGWFIPRRKIDMTGLLDSLVANRGQGIGTYQPLNRQYNLLKKELLKYYELEKNGEWDSILIDRKFYKIGDESGTILQVKKRLSLTGDLAAGDTSSRFDTALQSAVKRFQGRYGLKQDGAVGTNLLRELNRPIRERIRQLLINMERMRWVPADPPQNYLLVNIPAYKLFVYEDGKLNWDMNVVVGSQAHSTVIFQGDMKYVVFSPYWNVPPSIIRNEIAPGMKRDKNYLARKNMEWNNGAVRQKPGPGNSLGLVKFLFPNSYNIYLHDTPSKSLFAETNRAFSHGCIRLAEPGKLAEYLLRNDSAWTADKIRAAMNSGKEKYVTLKPTIPVFIGYFTAWVGSDGLLNFRDDIYGHDRKMAAKMFASNN